MTSSLRKFALAAHIIFSVGWLGAVVAHLVLAIVGLNSHDVSLVRAAYLWLEWIGWFDIDPFSLAALLTGLVQSLGTPWGLFRHHWILVKFLLTTCATVVLLRHMQAVSFMSDVAAERTLSSAAGGLLVLLAATTLSVYKPWGMIAYGRRRRQHERKVSQAAPLAYPGISAGPDQGSTTIAPRWLYVVGIHAIGLALMFVVLHLTGGGLRVH